MHIDKMKSPRGTHILHTYEVRSNRPLPIWLHQQGEVQPTDGGAVYSSRWATPRAPGFHPFGAIHYTAPKGRNLLTMGVAHRMKKPLQERSLRRGLRYMQDAVLVDQSYGALVGRGDEVGVLAQRLRHNSFTAARRKGVSATGLLLDAADHHLAFANVYADGALGDVDLDDIAIADKGNLATACRLGRYVTDG